MITNDAERRGRLIRQLEDALALTEEFNDPMTGFLIERALDEASGAAVPAAGNGLGDTLCGLVALRGASCGRDFARGQVIVVAAKSYRPAL
jgi:hypothetical protein